MKRKQAKLKELTHLRLWISLAVAVGALLSIVLQILHAPKAGGWVAMVVGGFPPASVVLCIELMTRIRVFRKLPAGVRILATTAVAGMAGVVSYTQQYQFIVHLGFEGRTATMFPLIIDGTMLVATISLVEVSGQVRALLDEIAELETAADEAAEMNAAQAAPVTATPAPVAPVADGKPGPNAQTRVRRDERARRAGLTPTAKGRTGGAPTGQRKPDRTPAPKQRTTEPTTAPEVAADVEPALTSAM